jgi:hypothetical protein
MAVLATRLSTRIVGISLFMGGEVETTLLMVVLEMI